MSTVGLLLQQAPFRKSPVQWCFVGLAVIVVTAALPVEAQAPVGVAPNVPKQTAASPGSSQMQRGATGMADSAGQAAGVSAAAVAAANMASLQAAVNGTGPAGKGRPRFPFPQCAKTTLSYDVSFVGPLKYIQVGTVRYAYHRFGPLNPNAAVQRPRLGTELERAQSNPTPNSPVVFISGWGFSMYIWPIPLLQRLAETREVVIFDNMRAGLSTDSSTAPLTIPMMASSTAALITSLKLQQPDIWSWSLGGCVGYALLADHSDKIDNIIIAAGSPGGPDAWLPPFDVVDKLATIGQNYSALLPLLFPKGVEDEGVCGLFAAYNSFYNSQYTQLDRPLGKTALAEQRGAVLKFFADPSVLNKLPVVTNRLLILHGVQDQIIPIRNAGLANDKILGSWTMEFPGEGHGIPFSHPMAVISASLSFFSFANRLTEAERQKWSTYGLNLAQRTNVQAESAKLAEKQNQTQATLAPTNDWLPVASSTAEATSLPQQQQLQTQRGQQGQQVQQASGAAASPNPRGKSPFPFTLPFWGH